MEYTFTNGYAIPAPGFGTYKAPDGEVCVKAVLDAIAAGYSHIDTAAFYENEHSVGEAVRQSGKPRSELFITSKVWNTERGYDSTLRACERSLQELGMDYLDLYLIHWPANSVQYGEDADAVNIATWKAMERLVDEGMVRSAGLSNFYTRYLELIMANANVAPVANQIEFHPGLLQENTVAACRKHGIVVEAWSPLGRGRLIDHPVITAIAARHKKTPAQVILRWVLQKDVLPIVKSVHKERIAENLQYFDFTLDADETASIDAFPEAQYGPHPDTCTI